MQRARLQGVRVHLIVLASAASVVVGLFGPPRGSRRWVAAVGGATALLGAGMGVAMLVADARWHTAPIWAGAVAAVAVAIALPAVWLLGDPRWRPTRRVAVPTTALCALLGVALVVFAWQNEPAASIELQHRATIAAALDVIVLGSLLTLTRASMADLHAREEEDRLRGQASWRVDPDLEMVSRAIWTRLIGLGVATVIVVLESAAEIARANGFDQAARPATVSPGAIAGGSVAILVLAFSARALAHSPSSHPPAPVKLSTGVAAVLTAAILVWIGLLPILAHGYQLTLWSWLAAILIGTLTLHSIRFHVAAEHGVRLSRVASMLAGTCALSAAASLLWLVAVGLRRSDSPVEARDAADLAFVVLITNAALTVVVAGALARGRSPPRLSRYTTEQDTANDALAFAGLAVPLAALPCLLSARVAVGPPQDSTTLILIVAVVAAMVQALRFLPLFRRTIRTYLSAEKDFVGSKFRYDRAELDHYAAVEKHFGLLLTGLWVALTVASLWSLDAVL
jgi:hypothetical protein